MPKRTRRTFTNSMRESRSEAAVAAAATLEAEEEDSLRAGGPLLREKAAARVMARKVTEVASQVAEAAVAEASDGAQRRAGRSQRRTDGLQPQDIVEQAQDLSGCFVGVQSPATLLL